MLSVIVDDEKYNFNHININNLLNKNLLLIHNKRHYQKYNLFKLLIDNSKKIMVFNPYNNDFYNSFKNLLLLNTTNQYELINNANKPDLTIFDDCHDINDFQDVDIIKNNKLFSFFNIQDYEDEFINSFNYIALQTIKKSYYEKIFNIFKNKFDNNFELFETIIEKTKENDSFIIINNNNKGDNIYWCNHNYNKIVKLYKQNFFSDTEIFNSSIVFENNNNFTPMDTIIEEKIEKPIIQKPIIQQPIVQIDKKEYNVKSQEEKKQINMMNSYLINPTIIKNNKKIKETIIAPKPKKIEKKLINMNNDFLINPNLVKNNKKVKETIIKPKPKKIKKNLVKMSNDYLLNPLLMKTKDTKETIITKPKNIKKETKLIKMNNNYLINPLSIKNLDKKT